MDSILITSIETEKNCGYDPTIELAFYGGSFVSLFQNTASSDSDNKDEICIGASQIEDLIKALKKARKEILRNAGS